MVLVRCVDIVESIFGYGDTIDTLIFWAILIVQRILRSTGYRGLNLLITILALDAFETKFCCRPLVCDIDRKRWVKNEGKETRR